MRSFRQRLSRMRAAGRRIGFLLIALFLGSVIGTVALRGQTSQNPHGAIKLDCQVCHITDNWTTMRADSPFKHSETAFPLEGQHAAVSCRSCHRSLEFSKADTRCSSCHQDVHENQFGDACSRCHTPEMWAAEPRFRQMHQESRFPLVGAHAVLDCDVCHAEGRYAETPLDCYGCHLQTYAATTNPDHHGAGFALDCSECHSILVSSWAGNLAAFQHTPSFPLLGGHDRDACSDCHQPGTIYSQTSSDCYSCHQSNYNDPQNSFNHITGNTGTNCAICHSIFDWGTEHYDHNLTGFPLTGGHDNVACNVCHAQGYTNTSAECMSCHQADFESADNPIHALPSFSSDCAECHSTAGWSPSSFNHNVQTNYTLTGAHLSAACAACHVNGVYAGTSTLCYSCHQQDFEGTTDPNHVAENYPNTCEVCHSTTTWDDASFDHNLSNFPLTGAHASLNCLDCHSQGYTGTPTDCDACHHDNFTGATNPIHTAPSFSLTCTECHSTAAWSPSSFNHSTQTNYSLTGAHVSAACADCHANGVYAGTSTLCYSCHQQDFEGTTDPNHVAENYPNTCEVCHSTTTWDDASFDHNLTNFPLTGAHTSLNCLDCHSQGYTGTPTACDACHHDNFTGANNPIHTAPSFSLTCTECHSTTAWSPSSFNHTTQTSYQLTGAHVSASCAACHPNGVYAGTSALCYSCHRADYEGAENHVAQNYPTTCEDCHTTSNWDEGGFNHSQTNFPLTGAHTSLNCLDCHSQGYTGTPTACDACHHDNFTGADNPIHTAPSFSLTCTVCHNTAAWSPSSFNHDTQTSYPLTGAHLSATCALCHANGVYSGTSSDCYGCHQANFNNANNPIHTAPSFSYTCTVCHNTAAWSPSSFDHSTQTNYPLTGAHISAACAPCHANGVYSGTPTDCYGCHQANFNNANNPIHTAPSFSYTCTVCHNTAAWSPSSFDHSTQTNYPLTGAHIAATCALCHANGVYSGTPTDCYGCHQANFNNANNPIHTAPSFSYTCTVCHNTAAWSPSNFNHNTQTGYPLTGSHTTAACALCHPNGQYSGTPTTCYFCHERDYQNAVDPNHQQAGFPTSCELCHTTITWQGATFDHDNLYFPIYSGTHHEAWNSCTDCHIGGNYNSFSCIDCHEHNQPDMNQAHQGVPGYVYQSQACFNCHPDGNAGLNRRPKQPQQPREIKP